MSQENVELIHGFYEAYNRGDMHRVPEVFDPEVVWNLSTFTAGGWPGQEVYLGPDGVTAFLTEWRSIFGQDTVVQIEKVIDAGERTVVLATQRSGPPQDPEFVHQGFAQVYSFRNVGSNGSTTTGTDRPPSKPWACWSRRLNVEVMGPRD